MEKNAKIYVAGHRGLVGSAIVRALRERDYVNLVTRGHDELDLADPAAVRVFFEREKPDYVFLAAAKVGGILANNTWPADFIRENLAIQTNVIHEAYRCGVRRLMFLGSSCIYPRDCPQPIKEDYLLTGPLEATNSAYALAKIAGVEMCRAYNRQHGTRFLSLMPTNLYGPGDRYDLRNSHVLPALIMKAHLAKQSGQRELVMWGTGRPLREFLYVDDLADACAFLASLPDARFQSLLDDAHAPALINIGYGSDVSIAELTELVIGTVGFEGNVVKDETKPDGTPRKLLDSSRLRSLGWAPRVSLRDGLGLTYAAFLDEVVH